MDRLEHLLAAVVPALFALAYGILKTRMDWKNEALWAAFFLGGLGAIVAPIEMVITWGVVSLGFAPLLKAAATATFVAAIPEETIKYFILVGAAEPHVDARRRQDLVSLAIAVSLGFATVENLFYVLAPANWQVIAATRALTAVPGHAADGLTMGALLTAARVVPRRRSLLAVLALLVPICMHAAYDFVPLALEDGSTAPAIRPTLGMLWLLIMLLEIIVAVRVCNHVLPMGREADRRSGRDSGEGLPGAYVVIVGLVTLVAVVGLTILVARSGGPAVLIGGVPICIIPFVLAIDLIRTGIREHRRDRVSTSRFSDA
ncbi:MAG TPA: PrsW family glutamic-type intramembrane protease [Xanthobacteraceae bacterium]|jgi:RsiW-degrading membrane proteinase PrsW (M82 family)|nr:PrsW family glutamic-type intramembrane protease [Xanthobacteraceae bacterium]